MGPKDTVPIAIGEIGIPKVWHLGRAESLCVSFHGDKLLSALPRYLQSGYQSHQMLQEQYLPVPVLLIFGKSHDAQLAAFLQFG